MNYRTAYKLRKIQSLGQDPLLIGLWGLILAKCCLLEHFVLRYAIPVDTGFYIWGLSIFMAAVATIVLSGLVEPRLQIPGAKPDGPWLWPAVAGVILLFLLFGLSGSNRSITGLLPIMCLVPSFAFILQGGGKPRLAQMIQAFGWLLAAGFLFLVPAPLRLMPLSGVLITLIVLPCALRFLKNRRDIRQAMRALQK